MTNVWACPSGIATAGRPVGRRFRNAFLGTVAAGALSLAPGGPALAGPQACTTSGGGTIETCTGNQSGGIAIVAPTTITTLNVNNLNQAIAPLSGTSGIYFSSAGPITVTSNTGAFGITTGNASGIKAIGSADVTVTSTGNIATAGGYGILAANNGSGVVTVTSSGNITTAGNSGIRAYGFGESTVTSTGNITTTGGISADGIDAHSLITGAVTVTSTGNITTGGEAADGISAYSLMGAVTVTSTGNITTAGNSATGISAASSSPMSGSPLTVTSTGNITTAGTFAYGINALSSGGTIQVTSTGNITTAGDGATGIQTYASAATTVTSTGNISTAGNRASGIFARGAGGKTVASTGNITTQGSQSNGIEAQSLGSGLGSGAVTVTSTGNITTAGDNANAIFAYSRGGGVAVTSTGNISTAGAAADGIFAGSAGADAVRVTSTGNITAAGVGTYGIFATSLGAVTVSSTGNITASGNDASAIGGSSTGGPIAITIVSGTVSGGSGSGAGVTLLGGTNNTLTNFGTVTALSGLAIFGDTGNNTVDNSGTVIGNVILGNGTNAFNNQAGGLFNSGPTVNLGASNTLTNAGTLSPGSAGMIQTTALTGKLVQTTTGRLLTDINIGGGTSDRVNVSGTANLAGAVQLQIQNPILGPWQQTILSATGGTTNNGLSLLLTSPALQAQLVFPNADDVVVKSSGINFITPGLNGNQTSVGNALNGAALTAGLGGPIYSALLNISPPGYGPALTQLSGEAATGSQQTTFDAMNLFMGVMTDPFSGGRGDIGPSAPTGYASTQTAGPARDAYAMFTKAPPVMPFEQRWNVWAAGYGGSQTTDGNAALGSNTATSNVYGTAVGADYRISPFTIAGFALAGGGTNFSVAGSGSGHSDLFQAGAFIRHTAGPAYISAALAYGWQDITTNRTVTVAGVDQLRAEFNANAFSGRLEGGYRFATPWMGITPYVAAQFTSFDLPAYAESALSGANTFALAYAAKDVTDTRSELGIRTDKSFALTDATLTLRGRLAWAYDFDPDRSIAATFQSLPGASFVVNGAAQAHDSALTTASAEIRWLNGWSAAATFEGEFSDVTSSYAGKGVVRYQW
jgi:uncharacterized protein with beta-barrel porin domain